MAGKVTFYSEGVAFSLKNKAKCMKWILSAVKKEKRHPKGRHPQGNKRDIINFIFCSDKFLLNLNKEYLKHNTLTDIITFNYSDSVLPAVTKELEQPAYRNERARATAGRWQAGIQSDIFISIERVKENAKKFNVSFEEEVHRVMIHGVLHLCGYNDKSGSEKRKMRAQEDFYLSWWDNNQ